MRQKNNIIYTSGNVVGIVDSSAAWNIAKKLTPKNLDFLEWRADCHTHTTSLPTSCFPWILTARHPAEGGANALNTSARRKRLLRLIDGAAAVDIEIRSLHALQDVVNTARSSGVHVIASFHDFKNTPNARKLRTTVQRAIDNGAHVVKIATKTTSAADVGRLLALLEKSSIPLAVMGMGSLGMASRLLFASCGSVLNYGWLHRPNAPGQWSAVELKKMLAKLPRSS